MLFSFISECLIYVSTIFFGNPLLITVCFVFLSSLRKIVREEESTLETKTLIRELERILIKSYRQNASLLLNQTHIYLSIYIYIYIYIDRYVCIVERKRESDDNKGRDSEETNAK